MLELEEFFNKKDREFLSEQIRLTLPIIKIFSESVCICYPKRDDMLLGFYQQRLRDECKKYINEKIINLGFVYHDYYKLDLKFHFNVFGKFNRLDCEFILQYLCFKPNKFLKPITAKQFNEIINKIENKNYKITPYNYAEKQLFFVITNHGYIFTEEDFFEKKNLGMSFDFEIVTKVLLILSDYDKWLILNPVSDI